MWPRESHGLRKRRQFVGVGMLFLGFFLWGVYLATHRFSQRYDALSNVGEQRLRDGDVAGARQAAEELLARDPLREEAHALLIAIHGLTGSRSQVVRQYRRLCSVLDRELDVEPLPESEATYQLALRQTLERSRARAASLRAPRKPTLLAVNA